jgi:hypothetical protein
MKTKSNIYRVKYNKFCLDFASALMNARYPERTSNNMSTKAADLPIHDWTSHYRTAFEYLITYIIENPTHKRNRAVQSY